MAFFLKYFKQRADYEAYMSSGNVLLPNVSMCADDESWTIYYNPQGIIVPNNEIWYTSTDGQAHPVVLEIIRKIVDKQYTEQELVVVLENMGVPSSYIPMVVNMFLNNDQTEASVIELLGGLAGIYAEEAIYLEDLAKNFVENIYDENGGILKFKDDYEIIDIHTNSYLNYFFDAETLESVNVPNSVTSIGRYAFSYCSGLTSITIGSGVTSIGEMAFEDCIGLTSVSIPESVTSIGNYAFYGCSGLTSVTIGNGVTSIGAYAFESCDGLTSVTIPNSVTSIDYATFAHCSNLTSITIPNSVTSILGYAFESCDGLTSVTIPNSVTSIGYGAFYGCRSITTMTIEATTPPTLGDTNAISTATTTIYVPSASVNAYKTASNWSSFASKIQAIP